MLLLSMWLCRGQPQVEVVTRARCSWLVMLRLRVWVFKLRHRLLLRQTFFNWRAHMLAVLRLYMRLFLMEAFLRVQWLGCGRVEDCRHSQIVTMLIAQRRDELQGTGDSSGCALDTTMVYPPFGGSAGVHRFWMQPAFDGRSGLLFPGYWMAAH